MEKKISFFIIIGLVLILAVNIFINFQTYSSKKAVEREREALKQENETLTKQISEAARNRKQLQ